MQLLVINPNTSSPVTGRLGEHVAAAVGPGVDVRLATARFGASYIADEASFAVAGHAALDAFATHVAMQGEPDAVLLGCFGDPGVWALREMTGSPVIGLAEAAMREAAAFGRFAIVTGGAAWRPMLQRLARTLGFAGALADVHVVAPSGAQLAADPAMALSLLRAACREAAAGAHAVILGGAALAGMADRLAPELDVPLIDSVSAGARAVVRLSNPPAATVRVSHGRAEWKGLSDPLLRRLR
jgi:allantoin racemase